MTREKAIKIIKEFISGTCLHLVDQEALETLIPELAESEDERIRKEIIDFIQWAEDRGMTRHDYHQAKRPAVWITWLEKQKENHKNADSIPSDCVSNAKCEDRWHKVKDSLPNSAREVLCKDAIGNYFIGRYYSKTGGVWEVSMYDDCDKSNEDNPPVVMWMDIPSEKQKEPKSISAEEVLVRAGLKPYKDGNKWCILAGDNIQEGICGFGDTIDEALYQFLMEVLEKQKEQKWSPSEGEMGVLYKLCYISNQITDEDDTELTRLYQDLKREYFNGHSFENMFPSEKSSKPELETPDWVYGGWDNEYMINTVIGRYNLHAEVAKKRGDTHDYNLSKSMENWLRNVVKPLILKKQKETGINWMKSDNVKNPDKPYIDKAGMFYTTDGRMCYASDIEKQKEQPITANDLDEEIERFFDECIEPHDAKIYGVDKRVITVDCYELTARHFAKWGEEHKEKESIKMEGTTICGQDYKCKKDYKEGNCRYIKDAIYHCGRDGYLTDQNGISWSCTPTWFKEYIQSNTEWAEEEKTRFVSEQFLQCKLSFDEFKEGEHYWLEYVGDDMYVGRSDNILNQKFHITPRQLYTLFSQQLEEVQGPPQEEKQVSLNYEPPFDENPSDEQIVDALIHHLNEQDGFLTAINCVSTKAILSWLKKQKENSEEPKITFGDWGDKEKKEAIITCLQYMRFIKKITNQEYDDLMNWLNSNLIYNLCKGWYLKKREQKEETLRDFIDNFPYSDKQEEQKQVPISCSHENDTTEECSEKDEKIRKALIEGVSQIRCKGGVTQEQMIAYLERIREKSLIPDVLVECYKKCGLSELVEGAEIVNAINNYYPQNLVLHDTFGYEEGRQTGQNEGVKLVLDNPEKYGLQKPADWSEEDEKMFQEALTDIIYAKNELNKKGCEGLAKSALNAFNWLNTRLKSIRPQPKAGLTRLDKNIINAAIAFVEQNDHFNCWGGIDKHTVIKALRSLLPSWKPSEEDLMMLEHIIGQYEIGNKNSKVMGYLPRIEELNFLKKVLTKWKNLL